MRGPDRSAEAAAHRAGIVLSLSALPWQAAPGRPTSSGSSATWTVVSHLAAPAWWLDAARRYSSMLGTAHLAPGAACALQHYTGRLCAVVVTIWAATGRIPVLAHERWWAELDEAAATITVSSPSLAVTDPVTATQLADELLEHLTPMVDGACSASRITRPVALGGPAASLATAFARIYRGIDPVDRSAVVRAAEAVQHRLSAHAGRPLLDLEQVGADQLHQHRRTCCLIRLGSDHGECGSCPRLTAAERTRRQSDAASRPLPPSPLTRLGTGAGRA